MSDDERSRRTRLRSFVIGSALGAAGAIATRRLRQPSRRPRDAQGGLAAFEDAPCFIEVVEKEAQTYRAGGEVGGDRYE